MKSFKFLQYFICFFIVLGCYGCKKHSDNSIQTIDSTKVYTGTIIVRGCPSFAIIKVSNAHIGVDWSFGNTYKNVIAISNMPDSIKSSAVSFNLLDSENYLDCLIQKACLDDIIIGNLPSRIYCAKNIKSVIGFEVNAEGMK